MNGIVLLFRARVNVPPHGGGMVGLTSRIDVANVVPVSQTGFYEAQPSILRMPVLYVSIAIAIVSYSTMPAKPVW